MARISGVAPKQLRALGRLTSVKGNERFYLAGGTAIAFHLGHRRSRDLDLFGPADLSFSGLQALARRAPREVRIVTVGEATLQMEVMGVPVDVVRYPYALLQRARPGPGGIAVAGLLDLATNKLAAIAKRGLTRDFWDLHAILQNGLSLSEVCRAYVKRFGVSETDPYHVTKGLTWFADAEAEQVPTLGMTPRRWKRIRSYFETEVPRLVLST